jgi:hypothetical protein
MENDDEPNLDASLDDLENTLLEMASSTSPSNEEPSEKESEEVVEQHAKKRGRYVAKSTWEGTSD